MISTYAIISTLVLVLPVTHKKLNSFCDENNISYDITVHLGRTLSIINAQSVNIDEHTKDRADQNKRIHCKAEHIRVRGKTTDLFNNVGTKRERKRDFME